MIKKSTGIVVNSVSIHTPPVQSSKEHFSSSFWLQILICILIALIACIPMLNGTIIFGSDTAFHINRIEGLVEAMQAGVIRPRIYWGFNYGFGYGVPLFYSDFFLYIPALLQLMGMGMIPAYRLFLFLIFFSATFAMYKLILSAFPTGQRYAWLGALLYVLCNYVFCDTYQRGAIGEALAYIFVPVVLYAMQDLIYRKGRHWYVLIIGFSGLLLSHNITFFLTCIFFGLFCIIHLKKILKNRRLLAKILAAAAAAFLLTAWFSLPMLEQLHTNLYRVSSYFYDASTLRESAVKLSDLLNVIPLGTDHPAAVTVGLGLLVLPALNLLPHSCRKYPFLREMTIAGYVMLVMTTVLFPWNLFPFMSFIQFPHRFFTVCTAPLCLAAVYALSEIPGQKAKILLACLSLIGIPLQIHELYMEKGAFDDSTEPQMMKNNYFLQATQKEWYDVPQLSTPDYLPANTTINYIDHGRSAELNGAIIKDLDESSYGKLSFAYQGAGTYIVPLTYYKGYSAEVEQNGKILGKPEIRMDAATGCVTFDLPDLPSEGTVIHVRYRGTQTQRLSAACSIMAAGAFIALMLVHRRKKRSA